MSILVISLIIFGLLVLFIGSGVLVGVSLTVVAMLSISIFTDNSPLGILSNSFWNSTNDPIIVALPLFILMGEILLRSNISENLFKALAPWSVLLPGGLIHVNVFACGLFASVS